MEKEKKIGEWKGIMVTELTEVIKDNSNFFLSDYIGLKADELNELKRSLEPLSCKYMVVKNSIVKIALKNAGLNELNKLINGGTGLVLGGDTLKAAKIITKFSKSHESLRLKGGYIYGSVVNAARVNYLASLPSRKELITKTVIVIKSPLTGFVSVLGNILSSLVYVLQAIKDKRENAK